MHFSVDTGSACQLFPDKSSTVAPPPLPGHYGGHRDPITPEIFRACCQTDTLVSNALSDKWLSSRNHKVRIRVSTGMECGT